MSAIKLTLHAASQEWNIHRETLGKALKFRSILPDDKGEYTIAQIDQAIHGDLDSERAGLVREQKEITALKKLEKLKQLMPVDVMEKVWTRIMLEYRQRVMSANIPDAAKKDLLEVLADPTVEEYFAAAEKQVKEE